MTAPCPFCGYDLSGIIGSWQDRCPLEGVCSECGQGVRWSEVFSPRVLPWFVERPGRLFPRRVVGTWVRTAMPWRFWRAIGGPVEGSAWRLAVWLPLLLVGLHLAKGVMANAARLIVHQQHGFNSRLWLVWASDDWTQPFILIYYNYSPVIRVLSTPWQYPYWPLPVWGLSAASLAAPALIWTMGVLTGRQQLQGRELARAAVYGLAWIPGLWLLGVIDAAWRLVRSASGAAAGADIDGWDVEWLFGRTWQEWAWWVWLPALWWVAWWWNAVMLGRGDERDRDLAAVVVGAGVFAGILAMTFAAWVF